MAHPTEAELRQLGQEILNLLAQKTNEEYDSFMLAQDNLARAEYDGDMANHPPDTREDRGEEIMAYIREQYGWLPDSFAKFAEPREEDFAPAIEECATTLMLLQPSLQLVAEQGRIWSAGGSASDVSREFRTTIAERVSAVNTQTGDWEGVAGNAFHLNYMNKFPKALQYQHEAVFLLAAALEANQKLFEHVGKDILHIGAKTKEALQHVTDKDPTGLIITLTCVAAVATVVATAGAAAPVLAISAAAVAASGSAAAGILGATASDPYQAEIEGATTQEIMVSMVDRMSDLYRFIDQEEQKIADCLEAVNTYILDHRAEIEIPLPDAYTDLDDASPDQIRDDFVHT